MPPTLLLSLLLSISVLLPWPGNGERSPQGLNQQKRERAMDRVVHLEEHIWFDIPPVPRYCDQMKIKKQRINVGDCELYVEEEGSGIPLVLINGGPGGTHHGFHPAFSEAKNFARVIYYDQRGCGLSDYKKGEGYSVDQSIRDLDNLRKALKIEKWFVLGFSYGGFLAQYYVTHYPENVAGLVLVGASPQLWVKMKSSRQYDFISQEERARMRLIRDTLTQWGKSNSIPQAKLVALSVYNNHLNGDWKRQSYYKPTRENIARMALYEWVHDQEGFRSMISNSMSKIELTGAFETCPIPTLILEGAWDLTWNTDKPEILKRNHPQAKLVMFQESGHSIFDDEPDMLFQTLQGFVGGVSDVPPTAIAKYKKHLVERDKAQKASPEYIVRTSGHSHSAYEKVVRAYSREWLDLFAKSDMYVSAFLVLGFAHYDLKQYEEALLIFKEMQEKAQRSNDSTVVCLSLIWQGHLYDLLDRRELAISCYRMAADMNIHDYWAHDQFGFRYENDMSAYAAKRTISAFQRIENKER